MYVIKRKIRGASVVWDKDNNVPLCSFVDGVFQTSDKATADKLQKLGYEVEGSTSSTDNLTELTVPELKKLAAEKGIDVPSKATKAEIIAALGDQDD